MADFKDISKSLLPKDKKQWKIFLACLLISTILWSLLKFSEKRVDDIEVDLKFTNFPSEKVLVSNVPKSISVTIETQGFDLLSKSIGFKNAEIEVDLSKVKSIKKGAEFVYYWLPRNNTSILERVIGSKLKNAQAPSKTDSVKLFFSNISTKKLNVGFDYKLSQSKDLFVIKSPLISPEKVVVRGAESILSKLDTIYTERAEFEVLEENLDADYRLILPFGVDSSFDDSVRVFVGVEALKEHVFEVPITIKGAPDSLDFKLFPSEVEIVFTCGSSELTAITPMDFKAEVDYIDVKSEFKKLNVELTQSPSFIKDIKLEPASVEYIIKSKD